MLLMGDLVELNEELAQVLRETRLSLELSQAELARRTNLSPATISAVEHVRFQRISKEHLLNIFTEIVKEGTIDREVPREVAGVVLDVPQERATSNREEYPHTWFLALQKLKDVTVYVHIPGEKYPQRQQVTWILGEAIKQVWTNPRVGKGWMKEIIQKILPGPVNLKKVSEQYEGEKAVYAALRYVHQHPDLSTKQKEDIFNTLKEITEMVIDLSSLNSDEMLTSESGRSSITEVAKEAFADHIDQTNEE